MVHIRNQIILILITVLVGAAGAKVLTIHTDPDGRHLWHEYEYLGEAPVSVELTPGIEYEITVIGEYGYSTIIDIEDNDKPKVVVLSVKNAGDFKAGTFMGGFAIGFLGPIVLAILVGLIISGSQ
ncbi:MAG: hypothetical protein GY771_11285 [bacterium]|nr:hypothetical protein [bacterium]